MEKAMDKVRELEGEIVEPKSIISNIGHIVGCKDNEGNSFGLVGVTEK
tara:strand:- start:298 stop:441 length:144 start_codon:yes stop_codon:yes gene_type:complete